MEEGEKIMNKDETFDSMLEHAKQEDWPFVDARMEEFAKLMKNVTWAMRTGLRDKDQNVRDLAATILDRSDCPILQKNCQSLEFQMQGDGYHIVRFRLAIALWKRNYRPKTVEAMMRNAMSDPDVGEAAKACFMI
jgi:hypothetical protein